MPANFTEAEMKGTVSNTTKITITLIFAMAGMLFYFPAMLLNLWELQL